ncbi:hypothetical protein [Streptomyces violaceusniger]|uniref:Uncharacterized protein n=1 Tax=Streptomyces violaceusniger (strain Tu 4113) TaxID=653045 RepID=G2PI18_STRV4|nr:hypothetical protein [Streptomyces violaceusniger]AEM88969.1 hypothetical protein Strvi_0196 [Streptomyces violaceusniger Tu 4113]
MSGVPREESHPYFVCPSCGIVGEPDSVEYALSPDREHVDWTAAMKVSCGSCRSYTEITQTDAVARDSEHRCLRCGHTTACPVRADRVNCWGCGLNQPGPASAGARADYLRDVERAADQWAAARVRVAKDDARERGTLPWWTS